MATNKLTLVVLILYLVSACGGGGGSAGVTPPANQAPTAAAGDDTTQNISTSAINLDASASNDPDNDALTFAWEVLSQPVGAAVTITSVKD